MAIHHNTHPTPLRPHRDRNPLQHAPTGQNEQTQKPLLSTPPLVPHARTPDKNLHVPEPEPGHGLHPLLHLLVMASAMAPSFPCEEAP